MRAETRQQRRAVALAELSALIAAEGRDARRQAELAALFNAIRCEQLDERLAKAEPKPKKKGRRS